MVSSMPLEQQTTHANLLECYKDHRVWTLKLNVIVSLQLGHELLAGKIPILRFFTKIGHNICRTPGTGHSTWCVCSWIQLLALTAEYIWDELGSASTCTVCALTTEAVWQSKNTYQNYISHHKSFPNGSHQLGLSLPKISQPDCGSNAHRVKPTHLCPGTQSQHSIAWVTDQITNAAVRTGLKSIQTEWQVDANTEEKMGRDSEEGCPWHGDYKMVRIKANCRVTENTKSYLDICRGPLRASE